MKVWKLLDGKKTTIGGALFLAAWVAQYFGLVDPSLVAKVNDLGVAFASLGLSHKVFKVAAKS